MDIELTEEEYALLPPDFSDKIRLKELKVLPREQWWNAKPVVVDPRGRMVKGSGKRRGSKDPVEVGKETAFTRSKTYLEARDKLISIENPDAVYRFEDLIDSLWAAVNGVPYEVPCPHPQFCDTTHKTHLLGRKVDTATAFKLYENLVGKAAESKHVVQETSELRQVLEKREVEVKVYSADPHLAEQKRQVIEGQFGSEN